MLSNNWTFEVTTLDKAIKYLDYTKLTLPYDSEMRNVIEESEYCIAPRLSNINVMIAYFKNIPIGWAWVFSKSEYEGSTVRYLSFMIYIQPKYRRRGVGSKLIEFGKKIARQRHQRLVVYPWDKRSQGFYNNNNIKEDNQRNMP
jgi:GNAT superfamily N-acetyltransferase